MSLYAIDKLIEETRRVASEFRNTTGTMLPVSAEIARYDVARLLGGELVEDRALGYDVLGRDDFAGEKIQVKSRVVKDRVNSGHRIGQLNQDADWDSVALSIMDESFQPVEIYLASREELEQALEERNSKRSKRGAMSVAKFMAIAELVWTTETGIVDNSPVSKEGAAYRG